MKRKKRDSPPKWRTFLRHLILPAALLAIGVCMYVSPIVVYFGKFLIYWPPVQYAFDSLKHRNHVPVRISKTSELIAFVCINDLKYSGNSLYTIRPDGSHLRQISDDKSRIHYQLDWSPDGEWLAFTLGYPFPDAPPDEWDPNRWYYEIHRMRYDGTEARRLTYNNSDEDHPQWSADGRHILFHQRWRGSWRLHRVGARANHTEALTSFEIGGFDLSPDRQKAVVFARNFDGGAQPVHLLQPDGADVEYLMTPDTYISEIEQSPDNQRILYYARNGRLHIYNIEAGREEPTPLIRVYSARWSPDSRWIAIIGGRDRYREDGEWIDIPGTTSDEQTNNLYLLDSFTSELVQPLNASAANVSSLSWSPKGKWLAFSDASLGGQVYKVRSDGGGLRQLTDLNCRAYGVVWSPK